MGKKPEVDVVYAGGWWMCWVLREGGWQRKCLKGEERGEGLKASQRWEEEWTGAIRHSCWAPPRPIETPGHNAEERAVIRVVCFSHIPLS